MSDPRDQLLRECARFLRATRFLYSILPEKYHAGHLSDRARDLLNRIHQACPPEPAGTDA